MNVPIAAAVAVVALAGCADPDPGTPVAADTPASTAANMSTSTAVSTSITTPSASRPKPIDMRGVDPCRLLREVRPTDFGIDMVGDGLGGDSNVVPGSKDCFASGLKANVGLGLTAVVTEGFDTYVGGVLADVTNLEVAGYRFAVVRPKQRPPLPEFCFAVLDVNDGQLLYLSMSSGSRQPPTSQDTMCGLLPRIAEAALGVLAG